MPLSDADKIQILLHEYDALRNLLISRHAAGFQAVSIGSAVLVGLITLKVTIFIGWEILIFLIALGIVIFILTVVIWVDRVVFKAASRLREIETEVNAMAIAPRLLRWHSEYRGDGILWKALLRPGEKIQALWDRFWKPN
jgi:hypothetical protein